MSGPSAIAKPMSAKMAVSSSITWLMGWMRPASAGLSGVGRVMSMVSPASRCSRAAPLSASRRAAIAAVTASFRPLISGPLTLRASGDILPSVASSAEMEPFLPSADTRTASSAASSAVASTMRINSPSSAAMSVMEASQTENSGRISAVNAPSPSPLAEDRGSSSRHCGLRLVDDCLERCRLVDGEIGQLLAVHSDPGLAEAGDKSAVSQSEAADRGVEALDPQSAERALAPLAVAESVLVCLFHRLLGDADRVLAPAVIAFGGFEDLLVLGVSGDTPF